MSESNVSQSFIETQLRKPSVRLGLAALLLALSGCSQVVRGEAFPADQNISNEQENPAGNNRGVLPRAGMNFDCKGITVTDKYTDYGHALVYYPVIEVINEHENPTDRYTFTMLTYEDKLTGKQDYLFSKGTTGIEFRDIVNPLFLNIVDFSQSKLEPKPTTVEEVQHLNGVEGIVPKNDIFNCLLKVAE